MSQDRQDTPATASRDPSDIDELITRTLNHLDSKAKRKRVTQRSARLEEIKKHRSTAEVIDLTQLPTQTNSVCTVPAIRTNEVIVIDGDDEDTGNNMDASSSQQPPCQARLLNIGMCQPVDYVSQRRTASGMLYDSHLSE